MATQMTVKEQQNLPPNEIVKNKENIQLIWLDENITDSPDCTLTKTMLLELNPAVQFYTDFNRCLDLIKSIKHEQIFLIVSGALAGQLLTQTDEQKALVAVFIFCTDRQQYEAFLEQSDKIIGIYTDQTSLLEAIREKMRLCEKQTLVFNLFDQKQKSMKDLSKESASFLWHQMLLYVLKQIPQDQQSKQQMIQICKDYYQNSKDELNKIEEFDKTYEHEQAIEWYTDDGFLYRLLNKALRIEDIHLLYTFRFFILDLCTAIEDQSKNTKDKEILKLYRGTQIRKEELQRMKDNLGVIISTNGFLSTSRNQTVGIQFAHIDRVKKDFEAVLFEVHADPSLKSISFADVESQTRIQGEEEVLFNLNSTFEIRSISFDETLNVWTIELHTTDKGSEKVQEYLAWVQQEMERRSPIIHFGYLLLYELGQVDQAKKYFEMLLNSLPSDHPDIPSVYLNIGNVHYKMDEWNVALKNYEIAYEICRERLPTDHPHCAGSLQNIGLMHRHKENYDLALDYYQKSVGHFERNNPGDDVNKAKVMQNMGLVYSKKNDFDTALDLLSRALEMRKRIFDEDYSETATCLGFIGSVYFRKGDFDVALDYHHQQLKMQEQCLPSDHPDLTRTLNEIISCYKKLDQIVKGLEFCGEKLREQKDRLGDKHRSIARIWMIMADIISEHNPDEILKCYEKALSILQNCTPPDHEITSDCLTAMAEFYDKSGNYEDALQCELKSLDHNRQALASDHVEIANNLRNVGLCYEHMNYRSEALRCYNESLSIYRANYDSNHELVKRAEEDIAEVQKTPQKNTDSIDI